MIFLGFVPFEYLSTFKTRCYIAFINSAHALAQRSANDGRTVLRS